MTALSGLAVLIGSRKGERSKSLAFFIATLGASAWAVSIGMILSLAPGNDDLAKIIMYFLYGSALVMDMGFIAYVSWHHKIGKIVTGAIWAAAIALMGFLIWDSSLLCSSITLSHQGNSAQLVDGWYYWCYLSFFVVATMAMGAFLIYDIATGKNKGVRIGNLVFLVGFSITGILSLIFDIMLPFWVTYDLIWIGPLAVCFTIMGLYYAILRYKLISISVRWLKVMSYIILICMAATLYMIIFFVLFTAIFKGSSPSAAVFILNFIMVVVILLLMPAFNEVFSFINSMINTRQVDLAFIVKHLNRMANNMDYNELAAFLADHLHFAYVGFIVKGRIYGSGPLALSTGEIREVSRLPAAEKGIWQQFNEPVSRAFQRVGVYAVAQLEDAKSEPFGQILVGKPQGKMGFERRDLVQLEMIINLVAALIDTKAK